MVVRWWPDLQPKELQYDATHAGLIVRVLCRVETVFQEAGTLILDFTNELGTEPVEGTKVLPCR